MDAYEFADKLFPRVSLEEIDFACDLEKVLAGEVKYLRHLVDRNLEQTKLEKGAVIRELHARLSDKDAQIAHLTEENQFLRKSLSSFAG